MDNEYKGNDEENSQDCEDYRQHWIPWEGHEMRMCFTEKTPKLQFECEEGLVFLEH